MALLCLIAGCYANPHIIHYFVHSYSPCADAYVDAYVGIYGIKEGVRSIPSNNFPFVSYFEVAMGGNAVKLDF